MNNLDYCDLEQVARDIRREFRQRKSAALKKKYKPGRTDTTEVWPMAARVCVELGASPEEFVQACFDAHTAEQGPFASALCGAYARDSWKKYLKNHGIQEDTLNEMKYPSNVVLEQMLESAAVFLKHRNGTVEPVEENLYVLRRTMFAIPLLARIYYGYTDPEVMSEFAPAARTLLAGNPALLLAVGKHKTFPMKELMEWKINS